MEQADRRQILANLNVVSRIDIPARHDAVDLRDDVAITKVQFGFREFPLGDLDFGLGLLDSRSLLRELGEDAVDIALFFEVVEHLLRALVIRMIDAELRRAVDQVRLSLKHGGKGLIEIGRHLA